jgi:hypothetical protein
MVGSNFIIKAERIRKGLACNQKNEYENEEKQDPL